MYTMPFFESTLTKDYNPLVNNLKNKYDRIYNPLKTQLHSRSNSWAQTSSPRFSQTEYTQNFKSSQYNGAILSPKTVQNVQLRSILKNPQSRRVSWVDQPNFSSSFTK